MEILLWLVPPAVVTLVAMAWVSWVGREGRGDVDRDEAARRLARAMEKQGPRGRTRTPVEVERSTGVALRPSVRRSLAASDDQRRRPAS